MGLPAWISGMDYRRSAIMKIADHFHVMTYAGQLIGCFALFDREVTNGQIKDDRFKVSELKVKGINAKELMYVYIDEPFRGLGLGKELMKKVRVLCTNDNANMIVLDTLNPNLNHFYEKCGATVVCEGELLKHPTSILRI
jgi:GNAT superfamily N-acetyltransferase